MNVLNIVVNIMLWLFLITLCAMAWASVRTEKKDDFWNTDLKDLEPDPLPTKTAVLVGAAIYTDKRK